MARALPVGTVTFLFTDIEGPTRLLQELGDGYPDVLDEQAEPLAEDSLLEAAVAYALGRARPARSTAG